MLMRIYSTHKKIEKEISDTYIKISSSTTRKKKNAQQYQQHTQKKTLFIHFQAIWELFVTVEELNELN